MPPDALPRVLVLGLGYIGLPTAALIARTGAEVIGLDTNPDVVATINAGATHIEEADLDYLVQAMVHRGRLRATCTAEPADVFVVAVPTPIDHQNLPDLRHVHAAGQAIAPHLRPGNLVLLESTVPVGATEAFCDQLAALRPDLRFPGPDRIEPDIAVAHCPERVLPGRILAELVANDRCIGGITPRCARRAMAFYRRFVRGDCVTTSARAAEMVKLAENSFRDVNIAFANELSMVAEHLGVNVWEVVRLANRHPRVNILQPGPGVGGHCIAVDPWFLAQAVPHLTPLIQTGRAVNRQKTGHVIARAANLVAQAPAGPIALLGLSFKPDVGDLRESPALEIARAMAEQFGPRIRIVEPHIGQLPPALAEAGAMLVDLDRALRECPILVLLVDHEAFRAVPEAERGGKTIYDTRGIWGDRTLVRRAAQSV
ncbi:MAG: UDP-N-acetyl-D-mannosamine dehydrogenase [Chakrabartia sp.]